MFAAFQPVDEPDRPLLDLGPVVEIPVQDRRVADLARRGDMPMLRSSARSATMPGDALTVRPSAMFLVVRLVVADDEDHPAEAREHPVFAVPGQRGRQAFRAGTGRPFP